LQLSGGGFGGWENASRIMKNVLQKKKKESNVFRPAGGLCHENGVWHENVKNKKKNLKKNLKN